MAIRQVREVPTKVQASKEPFVSADMREFVRCGMRCAVLEYENHSPAAAKASVESYVKAHHRELRGTRACIRQGRCYVYREEQR